jgi:hypothetical protein
MRNKTLHKQSRADKPRNDKGVALIIVIFAMMLFSGLAWSIMSTQSNQTESNLRLYESEQALYTAETGVQWATQQVMLNPAFRTDAAHGYPLGYAQHRTIGGEYQVVCRNPQAGETGQAVIESQGFTPTQTLAMGRRSIKSIIPIEDITFKFGLFASQAITMSGQARTDSYDSANGLYNQNGNKNHRGDVGTNGDIGTSGQAYIDGNASIGPSGIFNNQSAVYGTITQHPVYAFPPVSVPANLSSLPSSGSISGTATLTPGNYKYSSINLAGQNTLTLIGPINLYLTGSPSIRTSGQSKIVISIASTGPVKIYADGNIQMSGQGITNQTNLPENLIIYGTSSSAVTYQFTGQAAFFGAVYAPAANMHISGQGGFYGSFMGNTIDASGQAYVHYDESLKDFTGTSQSATTPSWQEQ